MQPEQYWKIEPGATRLFHQALSASGKTRSKMRSTFPSCRSREKLSAICSGLRTARISGSLSTAARKSPFLLPGFHGVRLDELVGLLAQHPRGGQVEQELAGEDQPAREAGLRRMRSV